MFVCLHFLIKFGHILIRQRGKSLWSVSYLVSYFLSPHPKPTSQFSSWKLSLWKLDEKGLRKKCSKEEKETRKNAALTLILNQITFLFFQCNTFAEKQENGIRWYLKCAIIEVYENRYLERFLIEIFCICICKFKHNSYILLCKCATDLILNLLFVARKQGETQAARIKNLKL